MNHNNIAIVYEFHYFLLQLIFFNQFGQILIIYWAGKHQTAQATLMMRVKNYCVFYLQQELLGTRWKYLRVLELIS